MTINIRRSDLYEEVWSYGVSKTAKKLNTTSIKLKSAIEANDIPIPSQSYWASIHMGKEIERQALPNSSNNVEINIKEKKSKINLTDKKSIVLDNKKSPKDDIEKIFSNINLNDIDSVNKALMNIDIPKNMPRKPEPLILQVMTELKEEKQNRTGSYYFRSYVGTSSYSHVLRFHRREEIEIGKDSLLLTNTLLKALDSAGAKISLDAEADAEVLIDGGKIKLKCHIPSKKVMLKTTDKRWSEYRDTTFEPIDEKVRFSVSIESSWSDASPIKRGINESNEEYLKRIFIKIIRLIPKSKKKDEEIRVRQIEFEKEERIKELHQKRHDSEYDRVKELINNTLAHEVASKIREYVKNSDSQNQNEMEWAYSQANWIDKCGKSDILNESDRQRLISYFLKERVNDNNLF
ncbi:hypothetical protein CPR19088_GLDEOEPO_00824 [Companilactobacillus paralimentarius]